MHYYKIYKPYGVLSQFSDKDGRRTLADLNNFPKDVYPIGRLDMDSEGLLILSDDKKLNDRMLNPSSKEEKEYYVQVENIPAPQKLIEFSQGIIIEGKRTLPAKIKIIEPPKFEPRIPPIRERKSIPDCWLSVTLIEGRNRQVRKMTAAIGCPTLRLVRIRIGNILLADMNPGEVKELKREIFY
ncbi:MAG: pseudouridine synthase [Melioribacteraceae bacterium]|nr:pseudouridine synthase [Melioribacteraceae bacterium]